MVKSVLHSQNGGGGAEEEEEEEELRAKWKTI